LFENFASPSFAVVAQRRPPRGGTALSHAACVTQQIKALELVGLPFFTAAPARSR
jgi:hypothetical protein